MTDSRPSEDSGRTLVRCPFCKELVYSDATVCKHCGSSFVKKSIHQSWGFAVIVFFSLLMLIGIISMAVQEC